MLGQRGNLLATFKQSQNIFSKRFRVGLETNTILFKYFAASSPLIYFIRPNSTRINCFKAKLSILLLLNFSSGVSIPSMFTLRTLPCRSFSIKSVIYKSESHDAYFNLALENWLIQDRFRKAEDPECLLIYRNKPSIIIGRNQVFNASLVLCLLLIHLEHLG